MTMLSALLLLLLRFDAVVAEPESRPESPVDRVPDASRLAPQREEAPPPPGAPARSAIISGEVRAKGNRRPIPGAWIEIEERAVLATGPDGRFEWAGAPGDICLRIGATAHRPARHCEHLAADQRLFVVYPLEPLEVNPYETVVLGERDRIEVSRVSLRKQESLEIPGTLGDPFRVAMLMPGVSSLASGLSYPVVRGTQPAATGFYIDGVRVPMLYHLLLGPAVVQPAFLDGVRFIPGALPVRYGGLIGGAVDAQVSEPQDRVRAEAYADLLNSAALLEYPLPATGTHLTLGGRTSYSALIFSLASRLGDEGQPFRERYGANFWDYQGRIEQKAGQWSLRLLALGSSDAARWEGHYQLQAGPFDEPRVFDESIDVSEVFHRLDARARRPLGGGELEIGVTLGADELGGSNVLGGTGQYFLREVRDGARAAFARSFSEALSLELRAELEQRRAAVRASGNLVSPLPHGHDVGDALRAPSSIGLIAGCSTQLTWRPAARWTLVPGLRFDSYHLVPGIEHLALDPRMAARWTLSDKLTLKAGAGLYHQPPTVLIPIPVADLAGLRHGLQEAVQTSVGAEWRAEPFEFSAEAFYNPLLRTVELSLQDAVASRGRPPAFSEDPASHGYAYGLELMLRRPLGRRWFGWLTYSYTRSRRWERFDRTNARGEKVADVETYLPFAYEQAHVVNATLSVKLPKNYSLGGGLHLHTGRPESGQLSSRTHHAVEDASGARVWTPVDRDQVARLPAYARVDLRAGKSWAFDSFTLEAYLDVFNLALREEVYAYEYRTTADGTLEKAPVGLRLMLPLLGVKGTY